MLQNYPTENFQKHKLTYRGEESISGCLGGEGWGVEWEGARGRDEKRPGENLGVLVMFIVLIMVAFHKYTHKSKGSDCTL